jgi:hypothetical protein
MLERLSDGAVPAQKISQAVSVLLRGRPSLLCHQKSRLMRGFKH